jgi:hypothetical protein
MLLLSALKPGFLPDLLVMLLGTPNEDESNWFIITNLRGGKYLHRYDKGTLRGGT